MRIKPFKLLSGPILGLSLQKLVRARVKVG